MEASESFAQVFCGIPGLLTDTFCLSDLFLHTINGINLSNYLNTLILSFFASKEPWARGEANGNLALPADGSTLVAKSDDNVLCFNVPVAYRAKRSRPFVKK